MQFIEYLISGMLFGASYSLVAIGFTLIFGVLDRLNIAHGATIMVSAYAGATIALTMGRRDELWRAGTFLRGFGVHRRSARRHRQDGVVCAILQIKDGRLVRWVP